MEKFGIYSWNELTIEEKDSTRVGVIILNNEDEDGGAWGAMGPCGPYVVVDFTFKNDKENIKITKKEFYICDEYDEYEERKATVKRMCKVLKCTEEELNQCIKIAERAAIKEFTNPTLI